MKDWIARRLSRQEKPLCRALWQEIFTEDSEAFLDYYDRWKTEENQCYGIFEEDRLVSMLELNPYRLMVLGHEVESRYIIGNQARVPPSGAYEAAAEKKSGGYADGGASVFVSHAGGGGDL